MEYYAVTHLFNGGNLLKKKFKGILKILIMVFIGIWVLSKIPFECDINHTITAEIHEDGVVVKNTTVIINGVRSNYLFANEQYFDGQFIIEYYERTGSQGMKANIKWNKEYKEQRILYYQNATFPTLEINHELLIDKEMKEFALGLQDGTIIATSYAMYQDYLININPSK